MFLFVFSRNNDPSLSTALSLVVCFPRDWWRWSISRPLNHSFLLIIFMRALQVVDAVHAAQLSLPLSMTRFQTRWMTMHPRCTAAFSCLFRLWDDGYSSAFFGSGWSALVDNACDGEFHVDSSIKFNDFYHALSIKLDASWCFWSFTDYGSSCDFVGKRDSDLSSEKSVLIQAKQP